VIRVVNENVHIVRIIPMEESSFDIILLNPSKYIPYQRMINPSLMYPVEGHHHLPSSSPQRTMWDPHLTLLVGTSSYW